MRFSSFNHSPPFDVVPLIFLWRNTTTLYNTKAQITTYNRVLNTVNYHYLMQILHCSLTCCLYMSLYQLKPIGAHIGPSWHPCTAMVIPSRTIEESLLAPSLCVFGPLIVSPSPTQKRAPLGSLPSGSRGLAHLPGGPRSSPFAPPWVFLP